MKAQENEIFIVITFIVMSFTCNGQLITLLFQQLTFTHIIVYVCDFSKYFCYITDLLEKV